MSYFIGTEASAIVGLNIDYQGNVNTYFGVPGAGGPIFSSKTPHPEICNLASGKLAPGSLLSFYCAVTGANKGLSSAGTLHVSASAWEQPYEDRVAAMGERAWFPANEKKLFLPNVNNVGSGCPKIFHILASSQGVIWTSTGGASGNYLINKNFKEVSLVLRLVEDSKGGFFTEAPF